MAITPTGCDTSGVDASVGVTACVGVDAVGADGALALQAMSAGTMTMTIVPRTQSGTAPAIIVARGARRERGDAVTLAMAVPPSRAVAPTTAPMSGNHAPRVNVPRA